MRGLWIYTKVFLIFLALFAAGLGITYVWAEALPIDLIKTGITTAILYVSGALIALISAPTAKHPQGSV